MEVEATFDMDLIVGRRAVCGNLETILVDDKETRERLILPPLLLINRVAIMRNRRRKPWGNDVGERRKD